MASPWSGEAATEAPAGGQLEEAVCAGLWDSLIT